MRRIRSEDAVRGVDQLNNGEPHLLVKSPPVIPGGWSDAHPESRLVEPMSIVIPPGWSGAPMGDGLAC